MVGFQGRSGDVCGDRCGLRIVLFIVCPGSHCSLGCFFSCEPRSFLFFDLNLRLHLRSMTNDFTLPIEQRVGITSMGLTYTSWIFLECLSYT